MTYLDLLMGGALARTIYRVQRGDSDAEVMTFLQSSYASASLVDLKTLLDVTTAGVAAAARLAAAPPTTMLGDLGAPPLPTLQAGTVMIESVTRITPGRGSRPVYEYVRQIEERNKTVIDWQEVLGAILASKGYTDTTDPEEETQVTPRFVAVGRK